MPIDIKEQDELLSRFKKWEDGSNTAPKAAAPGEPVIGVTSPAGIGFASSKAIVSYSARNIDTVAQQHLQMTAGRRNGGGPLILDNPFAKATNPAMWKVQRLLAAAMDVQLIFATALPDYNAVADFPRFIHLRIAGKNTKSNRWHLEIVDFTFRSDETEYV